MFQQPRPAPQLILARHDEGLLRLPHQPCRVFFHREDDYRVGWDWFACLKDMQAHGIVCWLVQDQGDEIKAHDVLEPAGQLVEKRPQIAVCDDRFRHGEQSPVWIVSGRCLSVRVSVCHRQDLPQQSIPAMPSMHCEF